MANIPVERTDRAGGTPWWAWLLGLIILIGLIWLLASLLTGDDPNPEPVTTTDTTAVAPAPGAQATGDEVITDVRRLADAPSARDFSDRQIRADSMRVEVAYSDSVFYAVPADYPTDRRFFVVVGDPDTPGIGGPATLNTGDLVTVHGTVREPQRDALEQWDITADERDRLMRLEDYYIRADRVER